MATDSIRCPVCSSPLVVIEFGCTRCRTPHHPECFSYAEGCAIYGCGGKDAGSVAFEPPVTVRVNAPPEAAPAIQPVEDQGFMRRSFLAAVSATLNLPWILAIVGISRLSGLRYPDALWPCAGAPFIATCMVSLIHRPKSEGSQPRGLLGRLPGLLLLYLFQILSFYLSNGVVSLNHAACYGPYFPYPTLGIPRAVVNLVTEVAGMFFIWTFCTSLMAPFVIAIEPECTALEAIRRSCSVGSRRCWQLVQGIFVFGSLTITVETVVRSVLPWMGQDGLTIICGVHAYSAFAVCHYMVLLLLEDQKLPYS